jgi:hypothetical protein
MADFTIEWHDAGFEPQCAPDPAYPDGIDLDMTTAGDVAICGTALPYPAPRCGYYALRCNTCGLTVGITTAGRPDDPRSVTVACQLSDKAKGH